MFKISRTTGDHENYFKISTKEGYVTVAGTSEFLVRMMKDMILNSEEFAKIFRDSLRGETIESVAAKMRASGFPENIVKDFENGNYWDDLIIKPTEDGR